MIDKKDIEKLAQLARIDLNSDEKDNLQKDLQSILSYVEELQKAPLPEEELPADTALVRNVLRADEVRHSAGQFTEDLIAEASETDGNYIKVKKIIGG